MAFWVQIKMADSTWQHSPERENSQAKLWLILLYNDTYEKFSAGDKKNKNNNKHNI